MRNLRLLGTLLLGLTIALPVFALEAAMAVAGQDQPPQNPPPARGRGRGRGAGEGIAIPGAVVRGARGAPAPIDPGGVQRQRLDLDTVLFTDAKGMTLYTYEKDSPGQSACTGPCATNWPPLVAVADATPSGSWTIITRADGTRQWAHMDRPLYTFIKDTKPGDRTGDKAGGGAWRAASPFVPYVPRTK